VNVGLYVTGHGFGHAVRCAEVARVLLARGAEVLLRTEAPRWLFPDRVQALPAPEGAPVDVGVVQQGGLELDIDATRRRWTAFARNFEAHADREAATLREARVDVVLADVPPLAFEAAARARIPSLALANFGWIGSTLSGLTLSRSSSAFRRPTRTPSGCCGCRCTVRLRTRSQPSARWSTCR